MNEYEYEPVRGLPEELPEGEEVVWRGEPTWRGLARRVFHVHALALYFAAIISAHAVYQWLQGAEVAALLGSVAWQLGLTCVALGILSLMAFAYARSTVYTVTTRRLVIRGGVAVPMMINIPWESVQSASLRQCRDGTGDIAFQMISGTRMAHWALWPNVRPWHLSKVQPMLRGIEEPDAVARALARTVTGENWAPAGDRAVAGVGAGGAVAAS